MDISIDLESQRLARKSMGLSPDGQIPCKRIHEFLNRAQVIKGELIAKQQRADREEILKKLALECAEEIHKGRNEPNYLIILKYMRQI